METRPGPLICPHCGSEIEVHLGIAPVVLWQAVRLQTEQRGAITFCRHCESYCVFGPGAVTDSLESGLKDDQTHAPGDQGHPANEHVNG